MQTPQNVTPNATANAGHNGGSPDGTDRVTYFVENLLDLADFISIHQESLYAQLEQSYRPLMAEPAAVMSFIANVLPSFGGIIIVGSSVNRFSAATAAVRQQLGPNADPVSVLSALTFIYVVRKGLDYYKANKSEQEQEIWLRMYASVQGALGAV
jgi:hypothetical protein